MPVILTSTIISCTTLTTTRLKYSPTVETSRLNCCLLLEQDQLFCLIVNLTHFLVHSPTGPSCQSTIGEKIQGGSGCWQWGSEVPLVLLLWAILLWPSTAQLRPQLQCSASPPTVTQPVSEAVRLQAQSSVMPVSTFVMPTHWSA